MLERGDCDGGDKERNGPVQLLKIFGRTLKAEKLQKGKERKSVSNQVIRCRVNRLINTVRL